jgi:hypothetical protein
MAHSWIIFGSMLPSSSGNHARRAVCRSGIFHAYLPVKWIRSAKSIFSPQLPARDLAGSQNLNGWGRGECI